MKADMLNAVDEKQTEAKIEKEKEKKKPKFVSLLDQDQVEVKVLDPEDTKEATGILKKCLFEVTEEEVAKVIAFGLSYGCYVNRMLIGVGLSWPTAIDMEQKVLVNDAFNAVYQEEPAVLLMYEGSGIRKILLTEREKAGTERGYRYSIAYLSEDLPKSGEIEGYIKETGSQLEKLYLAESYRFFRTEKGVLAVKNLG